MDAGHTVLLIEHHLDVIKTADHVIDLGPEGGHAGGEVVVTGTPEEIAACKASHTGRFLKAHPTARDESGDGIRPAMHPRGRRCSSFKYGPIFSVVAPCPRGASPVSVLATTFTTGC